LGFQRYKAAAQPDSFRDREVTHLALPSAPYRYAEFIALFYSLFNSFIAKLNSKKKTSLC